MELEAIADIVVAFAAASTPTELALVGKAIKPVIEEHQVNNDENGQVLDCIRTIYKHRQRQLEYPDYGSL